MHRQDRSTAEGIQRSLRHCRQTRRQVPDRIIRRRVHRLLLRFQKVSGPRRNRHGFDPCSRQRSGEVVFGYIGGIIKSVPALKQMVSAWRTDEIELNNGITISVKTSDYRTVRGVTLVCAIADEVAFWDSQGVNPDKQVFQALRPAMATIPEAKLLVISSPYAKYGVLFEAHHNHFGRDDSPVLVWQAPTTVMNPSITQEFIDQEMANDPDAGRSEWLAQFREDIEAAFSLESIESCVIPGRTELMASSLSYVAFVDPSGGRRDQFTVAWRIAKRTRR